MIGVVESIQRSGVRMKYHLGILSKDWYNKAPALRGFYRDAHAEIMEAGANAWGIHPYEIDWTNVFTPIELGLWSDIRYVGLVMYPQYPVDRFFVDFGNPVAKVAIECDGAAFHLDKAKDAERDRILAALGWTVHRISGRDCLTEENTLTGEMGAAGKFIRDICIQHKLANRQECKVHESIAPDDGGIN